MPPPSRAAIGSSMSNHPSMRSSASTLDGGTDSSGSSQQIRLYCVVNKSLKSPTDPPAVLTMFCDVASGLHVADMWKTVEGPFSVAETIFDSSDIVLVDGVHTTSTASVIANNYQQNIIKTRINETDTVIIRHWYFVKRVPRSDEDHLFKTPEELSRFFFNRGGGK